MFDSKKFDDEEIQYLKKVTCVINEKIEILSEKLAGHSKELSEYKRYIWDNIYEMDMVEKAANVDVVVEREENIARNIKERDSLQRLVKSPYFGRIDFSYDDDSADMAEKFYIGIRGFESEKDYEQLIYDWRAPVSAMFYDCEEGAASYEAPQGIFEGIVRKKRQYKIENGNLIYILDSGLKIDDEILQETLSRSSDSKMKNIVSTIQKEQNNIIRNTSANVLVVQGVAGSGKTSIALHRVAYILYAFKDKIQSNEILVVSPNHVFSDYISNVLPELGETNIAEMSLDDLLRVELKNICKVENRFDALESFIADGDEETERSLGTAYKSGMKFYDDMVSFFENFISDYVKFRDVTVGEVTMTAEFIKRAYNAGYSKKLPYFERFNELADRFINDFELRTGKNINAGLRNKILNALKENCLLKTDICEIYSDFLKSVSKKIGVNLGSANKKNLNYDDAFPMVFFKFKLLGFTAFNRIKHVVIDEMQDYSRVQFEILKAVFPCKMTILGDVNQVFVPRGETVLDVISRTFDDAQIIKIKKTYRSTAEITNFANKIIGLTDIIVFERHGTPPEIKKCKDYGNELASLIKILNEINKDGFKNIAIICKNEKESKKIYTGLVKSGADGLVLFTKKSSRFEGGIAVLSSYLAKGLEFDVVIIPNVDEKNYFSSIDRQILYVSCTRALHRLYLLHTKKRTKFL